MKDISKLVFGDGIFSALPSAHARSDNETLRHAKTQKIFVLSAHNKKLEDYLSVWLAATKTMTPIYFVENSDSIYSTNYFVPKNPGLSRYRSSSIITSIMIFEFNVTTRRFLRSFILKYDMPKIVANDYVSLDKIEILKKINNIGRKYGLIVNDDNTKVRMISSGGYSKIGLNGSWYHCLSVMIPASVTKNFKCKMIYGTQSVADEKPESDDEIFVTVILDIKAATGKDTAVIYFDLSKPKTIFNVISAFESNMDMSASEIDALKQNVLIDSLKD